MTTQNTLMRLLGHCGVYLSTCQVDVLINLGLEGDRMREEVSSSLEKEVALITEQSNRREILLPFLRTSESWRATTASDLVTVSLK